MFRNLSHPQHSLELKNYLKPYTCDGSKEKGFGPRYRCEKCDFDLHKECMFSQISPVFHDFFPNSAFKFFRTPPKACHDECKRKCDACRKLINGFVYHCQDHDLDLHPCCKNLNKMYNIEDVKFNLHKKVRGKCLWCKRKSIRNGEDDSGWSYMSECGKYHVHVACVTKMALEEWNESGGEASGSNSSIFRNVNNTTGGASMFRNVNNTTSGTSMFRNVNNTTSGASMFRNVNNATSGASSGNSSMFKNVNNIAEQSLAKRLNLNAIQDRGRGNGGTGNSKYWRILKIFIKTIVSIVIGDPTMVLASLFVELLA